MRAALLLALLLLPTVAAQGAGGDGKTFALIGIARAGSTLELTVTNVEGGTGRVVAALLDGGVLLAPEMMLSAWPYADTRTLRFDLGDDVPAQATLRLTTEGKEDALAFRVPPQPQDAGGARVEVVDVSVTEAGRARLTLRSTGSRAAGPIVVGLEDAQGTKVSDPLTRTLAPLEPGAEASVEFGLPADASSVRVVATHQNQTEATTVRVPPRPRWVEVVSATLGSDGNATFALRAPSTLGTVEVSVEDMAGVVVGEPLSRRLDGLGPSGASVAFQVPGGVDEVKLVVRAGDRTERFALRLAAATGEGGTWRLSTDLPSREGQPGGTVAYQLTLENDGPEALASLRAEGLPAGYDVSFAVDGSVVPEVLVPRAGSRRVVATVTLPEAASRDAGSTLPFSVVTSTGGEEAARLDLSLVVRGRGRLELQGQNWFTQAAPGAPTEVTVTVRNTGSAALLGVDMAASAPAGWVVTFSPPTFDRLEAGESREVDVTVDPPEDAGSGRYLVDVAAATDDVSARPRSLSVEVATPQSSRLPWLLGAGVALVMGVALVVKLRRR